MVVRRWPRSRHTASANAMASLLQRLWSCPGAWKTGRADGFSRSGLVLAMPEIYPDLPECWHLLHCHNLILQCNNSSPTFRVRWFTGVPKDTMFPLLLQHLYTTALRPGPRPAARTRRSGKLWPPGRKRKRINLALQGGGANGAYTWGVLDQLLADGRLEVEGISGASAGALNTVMLADGLARGGPEEARTRLADFWRAVSSNGHLPDLQRGVTERLFSFVPRQGLWFGALSRFW